MKHWPLYCVIIACCFLSQPLSVWGSGLYMVSTHTGDSFKGTFKENGVYDEKNCLKIDHLLRDHRTNEVHKIDRNLLDYAYKVAQKINPQHPEDVRLEIVSGFRSCATNEMLRSRCTKVSKNSNHMLGKALDFFVKGVPIKKLGQMAKSLNLGGTGIYVGAGFIHIDTGKVRCW